MRRSTRVLDRLFVGLIGLLLVAGGVWLIGYRTGIGPAVDTARRLDAETIADAPQQGWWVFAVGGAGLLLVLMSVWLLLGHLRSASATTVDRPGGTVDVGKLADAAAADLGQHPAVERTRVITRSEGGRPVVRIRARVDRDADIDELSGLARTVRHELERAVGPDVVVQVLAEPGDAGTKTRVI